MIKIFLSNNLSNVNKRINSALDKSGRSHKDITLIGVTKYVDSDLINEAIDLGIEHIGESKVQQIQQKVNEIKKGVHWHMIGHLQTNKVKYIINKIDLIHSLDRLSLAKELHKRAVQNDIYVDALIQVNISGEESKFGISPQKTFEFIEELYKLNRVRVKGLMTMAPFYDNPEDSRYVFKGLKDLSEEINKRGYDHISNDYLSMGMTNDFEVAIEEGSNMVRIGTGIFKERK